MGRKRKKEYLDIALQDAELKRIRKGYKIAKIVKGQSVCVYLDGRTRKNEREIVRLKAEIKRLEGKVKNG